MSDREFEIGGRKFKLCKIDVFKQFHIARRIGPMLSDIFVAMKDIQKIQNFESLPELEKLDQIAKFSGPVMGGLSKLSDADADLVLYGLLSSVEMFQSSGNWAKVSTNSMLMIQDLELPVLLQLAGRALGYNLSGFFAVLSPQT